MISAREHKVDVSEKIRMHQIECQVDLGEGNSLTVFVGTHDIIESAAYLLERKFRNHHGLDSNEAATPFYPYKSAESIINHKA